MMVFSEDGQVDPNTVEARDRRLGVSTAHKRENRRDIPTPSVHPMDNSWESGRCPQTSLEERKVKR